MNAVARWNQDGYEFFDGKRGAQKFVIRNERSKLKKQTQKCVNRDFKLFDVSKRLINNKTAQSCVKNPSTSLFVV